MNKRLIIHLKIHSFITMYRYSYSIIVRAYKRHFHFISFHSHYRFRVRSRHLLASLPLPLPLCQFINLCKNLGSKTISFYCTFSGHAIVSCGWWWMEKVNWAMLSEAPLVIWLKYSFWNIMFVRLGWSLKLILPCLKSNA